MSGTILAHAPVTPATVWHAWTFDPSVLAILLVTTLLYARGAARLGGSRHPAWRSGAFAGAVLVLVVALISPLDAMAEALFSAHMVQHLLLIVVAAPLLVLARPVRTGLASLPAAPRRAVVVVGVRAGAERISRTLRRPGVAWSLFTVAVWAWHVPVLYQAALEHPPVHALEHAAFLLASMLTWAVAFEQPRREGLGALGRVLFLVACAVQSGLLGAVLLFATTRLYPVHGLGPATWGLTPMQDQQLAGALMWIPPSAVYLPVAAALLIRWFRSMDAPSAEPRPHVRAVA